MRRIIKGKAYNTDTADEVHVGELVGDGSNDWWALYRKRNGEFFKVIYSAAGDNVLGVEPLGDAVAKRLLASVAPEVVRRHFGRSQFAHFEKKLCIRVSGTLASRLEELAKQHGLSLNAYAAKYLARCLETGNPSRPLTTSKEVS
ncbi:toxin-antitoxin system HicB family antitoxin [Cupriavidus basilensis]